MLRNKASFYGEELSAPRPTPKLEDHPLSGVAATLHIGGRSSIRNPRTCHTVVTGTLYRGSNILGEQNISGTFAEIFVYFCALCNRPQKPRG